MISLRQHIFSLVAVFVALAVGIAAGSTVVRGPLLDSTRARLESAEQVIAAERAENEALAAEVAQLDGWALDGPGQLLTDQLDGRTVFLVVAGDADSDAVDGILRSLRSAGGVVLGELRIDTVVFDPAERERVSQALEGADVVEEDEISAAFGEELARRIVGVSDALVSAGEPVSPRLLLTDAFGDLEDAGLVDLLATAVDGIDASSLDVLVLTDRNLAHDPSSTLRPVVEVGAGPDDDRAVLVVAEVGRVLQGNETPVPLFVTSIRDDGRLRDEVATVDNAETFLGWLAAVLALEAAVVGDVGHFGFREGADRSLPPAGP